LCEAFRFASINPIGVENERAISASQLNQSTSQNTGRQIWFSHGQMKNKYLKKNRRIKMKEKEGKNYLNKNRKSRRKRTAVIIQCDAHTIAYLWMVTHILIMN